MTADNARCELHGEWVFLSASYPHPSRDPVYVATADVRAISNAVVELARAVFESGGSLVFGGHPTISPLVLRIAACAELAPGLNGALRVRIYQSAVFTSVSPIESKRIGELGVGEQIVTERVGNERPEFRDGALVPASVAQSLALMRRRMIADSAPVAGVFVGGMEGVEKEYEIAKAHSAVRCYLVAGPGGAARVLADHGEPIAPNGVGADLVQGLYRSQLFPWLMRALVADISTHVRGKTFPHKR